MMDNHLKEDRDVLSVKEKGKTGLRAATMDKNGKAGADRHDSNNPDFVRIDTNSGILENFFANFMRQMKHPTHFEFFRLPAWNLKESAQNLEAALRSPNDPKNCAFIDMHRVAPEAYLKNGQQQQQMPVPSRPPVIDHSLVDWENFANYGITRENLEKSREMDRLLNCRKTGLMPVTLKLDGVEKALRTDGRFSLRKTDDGTFSPVAYLIRYKPELDRPYFGVQFTEEDKQRLLTTGNPGRVVDAEFKQGEKTPVYVTLDKLTNLLVTCPKDRVKVPDTYKGVQLSPEQKRQLGEGKAVRVEDMTSSKGTKFSAGVQFNADRRYFELLFNSDRKQTQKQTPGNENGQPEVPKTFRK